MTASRLVPDLLRLRVAEPGGHPVERGGALAELALGELGDALIEVACGDALGALQEGADAEVHESEQRADSATGSAADGLPSRD